jgi:UDPglucose 6-dehydrogenase
MKITVIGKGYIGLGKDVYLSDVGIEATCVDIDQDKNDYLEKQYSSDVQMRS